MREMKDSGVEWIGDIPNVWDIVRLRFLTSITTGNMDTQDNEPTGQYPFYVRSPIVEHSDNYTFDNEAVLMAGDGVGAGKVFHYVNGKYGCHQRVYSISGFKRIKGKFLYYYLLENFYKKIEESNAKSTVDSVRLPMLKDFLVAVPDSDEQDRIVRYLDKKCKKIDEFIASQELILEKLKEYRISVITEAVTKGIRTEVSLKDSGINWMGMIPAHWKTVKIKYLGGYWNGLTYSPEDIVDESEGTLVLRSSNIQDGKLCFADNVYVNSENSTSLVKKGDILICSRNGSRALIGKNALIEDDLHAYFGAFMMIYRCQDPQYIRYILNSSIFTYYLGSFFTSTINQLTGSNFGNMIIPYCDDENERKEIINYLDEKVGRINKVLEEKVQLIEKLNQYKRSLIYEVVTGKKEV